jgi:hypothetical protein
MAIRAHRLGLIEVADSGSEDSAERRNDRFGVGEVLLELGQLERR